MEYLNLFLVEYYAFVIDHHAIEKQVHNHLNNQKKNSNRDFFNCTVLEAINTIKMFAKQTTKYEEYLSASSENKKEESVKNNLESIHFDNGDKYYGECLNGFMHGQGTYFFF